MVDRASINPGASKYIEKIESRLNRKARLAHDLGAGAPCLKCGDKCPGFELHYWRKVCLNCRCSKDDHDIQDDDEDIGHFIIGKLFNRPDPLDDQWKRDGSALGAGDGQYSPSKAKAMAKKKREAAIVTLDLPPDISISSSTATPTAAVATSHKFEWVPPNITAGLAARYMIALPPEKRPIAGSQAAKERRQQLGQQIPVYDMDETRRCEAMPEEELQLFKAHLDHIKTYVVGQGIVSEIHLAPKLLVGKPLAIAAGGGEEHGEGHFSGQPEGGEHPSGGYAADRYSTNEPGSDGYSGSREGGHPEFQQGSARHPLVGAKTSAPPSFHVRDNTAFGRQTSSSVDNQTPMMSSHYVQNSPFATGKGYSSVTLNINNNNNVNAGSPTGEDWPAPPSPMADENYLQGNQQQGNFGGDSGNIGGFNNVNSVNNNINAGQNLNQNQQANLADRMEALDVQGNVAPARPQSSSSILQSPKRYSATNLGTARPYSSTFITDVHPSLSTRPVTGSNNNTSSSLDNVTPSPYRASSPGHNIGTSEKINPAVISAFDQSPSMGGSAATRQFSAPAGFGRNSVGPGGLQQGGGTPNSGSQDPSGAADQVGIHHDDGSQTLPGSFRSPYKGAPLVGQSQGGAPGWNRRSLPLGYNNSPFGSSLHASNLPGAVTESQQEQAHVGPYRERLTGSHLQHSSSDNVNILLPGESVALYSPAHQEEGSVPVGDSESGAVSKHNCEHCSLPMMAGEVAVICERAGPLKFWHPGCFVCTECGELLADMIYFWHGDRIYCGRHYHKATSVPRCHACDELIFSNSWTRAEEHDWHLAHFSCFLCDTALAGKSYVPSSSGHPYCLPCHMAANAQSCETCEQKIEPGSKQCQFRGYHFHATDECFCCHSCKTPMLGGKFKLVKNWVFCSASCVRNCQEEIDRNPYTKFKHGDEEK
uniref:Testin n=1 Tax=Hirondellea gigas TaxID=1518452 RepID=A0A6A7G322_9CRUS